MDQHTMAILQHFLRIVKNSYHVMEDWIKLEQIPALVNSYEEGQVITLLQTSKKYVLQVHVLHFFKYLMALHQLVCIFKRDLCCCLLHIYVQYHRTAAVMLREQYCSDLLQRPSFNIPLALLGSNFFFFFFFRPILD